MKCQFRRSGKNTFSCTAHATQRFSVAGENVDLCPTHAKVSKNLHLVQGDSQKIEVKKAVKKAPAKKVAKKTASAKKPVKKATAKTAKKPASAKKSK